MKHTMEKNKLTSREELKAHFAKGESLDQSDFLELIDSFRYKEETLTHKEAVILANTLRLMDNGYIQYYGNNIGEKKFQIIIAAKGEEEQVITLREYRTEEKRYLFGSAPYNIKVKNFPPNGLDENEYYSFILVADNSTVMHKLFGNNLPVIPDGFDFGLVQGKILQFRLGKQKFAQRVNIVNTNIKFVNKTTAPVSYGVSGLFWSHGHTNTDIITDHYDLSDSLGVWYKADLRGINKNIECKIFDVDKGVLLMTAYLNAGENNQEISGGGQFSGIRNIRIECDYISSK